MAFHGSQCGLWSQTDPIRNSSLTGARVSQRNRKTNQAWITTEVKGKKGEGKTRYHLNTPFLSCLGPSLPKVELPLCTFYLCHAENPDIKAAFANKVNIKGNITISYSKKHFTDSTEQHMLNHKIGHVIYVEKNQSLIILTALTDDLGSILQFKFTSYLKGNKGDIQL